MEVSQKRDKYSKSYSEIGHPSSSLDKSLSYFYSMRMCPQVNKLASLDTFMRDISTGLDAEVSDGPEGKDNLMKVCHCPACIGIGRCKNRISAAPQCVVKGSYILRDAR